MVRSYDDPIARSFGIATALSPKLRQEMIEWFEHKSGRKLTEEEANEGIRNLVAFLDLVRDMAEEQEAP